jgi:glutaredoxin
MAKDYFKAHNVAFTELNVAEDDAARDTMVKKSEQLGVPVIDVNGHIVVGFNERKLAELLGIKK